MGIIKKVGYGVVGLIAIGVIGAAVQDEPVQEVQKVAEVPASTPAPKEAPKPVEKAADRPTGDKGVTEDNFNKIVQGDMFGEGGMGKTEVFDMLGNADTFTTSKVNDSTIETASWNTKDYKMSIMIQFHNGKVSSKTITKL